MSYKDGDQVRLVSRQGKDFTRRASPKDEVANRPMFMEFDPGVLPCVAFAGTT